ncbi:LPS-assembly protein LptD [Devosia sp.]|uniref:LPS-assembly protein LptD n=1 Tax=Devosia sp. TaxID=1871048 RepID=UPI003A8E2F2E
MGRSGTGRTGQGRFGLAAGLALALLSAMPAQAQFVPVGFFSNVPEVGAPAAIEADYISYDSRSDVISAEGTVRMRYEGYLVACDSLRYAQGTGELTCVGNGAITDPDGNHYVADRFEMSGGLKSGFVQSLRLTTSDGALITARDASFVRELQTILNDATYAPCGLCTDGKGNRIGWGVRAAKIIRDDTTDMVTLEQPVLEILGIPVAWLPWISLPDPSKPRNNGFLLPSVDYSEELGARITAPYFISIGDNTDILLSPSLMSRQGFLMGATWEQRFDYGKFDLEAAGIYQLDPSAFAGTVGDRDWRWTFRGSGEVKVADSWSLGGRYTSFSDAAFLDDYGIDSAGRTVNEVYATHVSDDFFADFRLQQFLLLGNVTDADQNKQALAVPNLRTETYGNLDEYGQVRLSTRLLGVIRGDDSTGTYNGVDYVFGLEGTKVHGVVEGSWEKQAILPGGLVATPFLGVRGDVAYYDGASADAAAPAEQVLYSATPIAAIDMRFPMITTSGFDTHLLEPVAQLVYRGSDTTLVGITNDDAHSFVLDDTNMFAYNRFTGIDRQETGLRANVGARYLANFAGGQWLEVSGGQSFHLAGVNGMGIADEVNTGVSTGLGDDASYIVLAARGAPVSGLTLGTKVQIMPDGPSIARAGLGAEYRLGDYWIGGDYVYLAADSAIGVIEDQHEIAVRAGTPLPFDYWTANGGLAWDISTNQFLEATGEVAYDDDYFLAGAFAKLTGLTHTSPDALSFGVMFRLKGPGMDFGL